MLAYERVLNHDVNLALKEGSLHFDEKSAVHDTLRKLTSRLDAIGIDYAIVGGMALFLHGFRRFTEDVDVLVTATSLEKIHEQLAGLGYLSSHAGSKNLRDTETGVRIEFLVTGGYPGDGKPKPVAFPDPAEVNVEKAGIKIIELNALLELKLASGMSAPHRQKDLADVQEIIRVLRLPRSLAAQLNPYVRDRYAQLWEFAQAAQKEEDES